MPWWGILIVSVVGYFALIMAVIVVTAIRQAGRAQKFHDHVGRLIEQDMMTPEEWRNRYGNQL